MKTIPHVSGALTKHWLVLALCAWPQFACQQFELISDCQRFIGLSNEAMAKWEELQKRNEPEPQADIYETLATEFTDLEEQLKTLEVNDRQLEQAISGYRSVLKDSAKYSLSYSTALRSREKAIEAKDAKTQSKAERELANFREEMKKVLRSHKSTEGRINAACQPGH